MKVQKQSATHNIMEISYHVAFFVPTNTTIYKTVFYYKRDSPPKTIYLLMLFQKSMIMFVCGVKRLN